MDALMLRQIWDIIMLSTTEVQPLVKIMSICKVSSFGDIQP